MNFRKNIYAISISTAMLAIAGCGITPQDEGIGSASPVSGVVVDGYLAGATIYVDVNENNKLDAWENRALTDNKGYFTTTPDGVNYCTDNPTGADADEVARRTRALRIHCLESPAGYDEVMIRMTGGYDPATVEPFIGTISVMADLKAGGVIVATPVTGLLAEVSDAFTADQISAFMVREGLADAQGENDMSKLDFLDFSVGSAIATEADRLKLLKLALQAHKVADITSNLLDADYNTANGSDPDGFFGVNKDVPTDVSSYVYRAMVSEAISTGVALDTILTTEASLALVVTAAVANINSAVIVDHNDRDEEGNLLTAPVVDATTIAKTVIKVAQTIKAVFASPLAAVGSYTDLNNNVVDFTFEHDAISRIRAIDVVVTLTRDGNAVTDAIDWATTNAETADYLTNLKHPAVDMVSLKGKFVAGPLADLAASDYSNRASFSGLFATNNAFSSTDPNAIVNEDGFGGNTLALDSPDGDGVQVDFGGSGSETSGDLSIAADFIAGDFAATQDKLDADGNPVLNPDGTVVQEDAPLNLTGSWEKIDDYTMLMNIEVTEGVFTPVIVKPDDNGGYYFDLGGEQVTWEAPTPTP